MCVNLGESASDDASEPRRLRGSKAAFDSREPGLTATGASP